MTSLTKREVQNILKQAFEPVVSMAGFRASGEYWLRDIPGGRQSISVAIFNYRPKFEFTASVGIRLDAVEDFVAPFAGVLPEHQSITLTSLTQLEHFGLKQDGGLGVRYRGDDAESIGASALQLAQAIGQFVVPFLDSHQDLSTVETGLNPPGAEKMVTPIWPDDRTRFDGSVEPYRAMRGIATAYLAGNPRLPALIRAYRGQLSNMIEEIRSKYEALAAEIERRAS